MKSIGSYLLTGAGVLVLGALIVGYFTFGSVDAGEANKQLLLEASLAKKADHYAKCYNSINYGTTMVGNVSISYLYHHEVDRLHEIENAFMEQVKQQCEKPVAEYEAEYKKLAEMDRKLAEEASWKSFLFSWVNPPDSSQVDSLEPSTVRFSSGNPMTNFIFTREEVEKFFQESLAT